MKIKESYPVFVTNQLKKTKDYYVAWFEFEVFFESNWFILLRAKSDQQYFIAFMDESHPSAGVFMTFEVEDAAAAYQDKVAAGLEIYYPLRAEAWGQKRFGLIDPNGMYIDIVEQIEPTVGYWDQYMAL